MTTTTPMMAQWHALKEQAKDALLFFRLGDFYEAFHHDAETISSNLDLCLTKRQDVPMCGVPAHAADNYIDKLLAKGFKVAVAEQTEDPKNVKGLVKREIVRIVSPGTLVSSSLLEERKNNYFASIARQGSQIAIALIDLSCARFSVQESADEKALLSILLSHNPRELLVGDAFFSKHPLLIKEIKEGANPLINTLPQWRFSEEVARDFLLGHFGVKTLEGFGLAGKSAAISAAGALLCYLQEDLSQSIKQIEAIELKSAHQHLLFDRATIENLAILTSPFGRKATLLEVIDHTVTPMGGRKLAGWLAAPLLNITEIQARQQKIHILIHNKAALSLIRGALEKIRDLERLYTRIGSPFASPRDLASLAQSLMMIPYLKEDLTFLFPDFAEKLEPLAPLVTLIQSALVDEPPQKIQDGGAFRSGFHKELDELHLMAKDSKAWLLNYQERLKRETGIKTLKVGYNRMFGYYIEVSKGQQDKAPPDFERRQTLTNGERYTSIELKNYEKMALGAEMRIRTIETELFSELKKEACLYGKQLLANADVLSSLDALASLATAAALGGWCCPTLHEGSSLEIIEGRHPVIENALLDERFIPNDTRLGGDESSMMIITGPNMAGKSTYIRQVALIVILAHTGSFVPAKRAEIPLTDKVFSRIGASDNLARGQSTFMVEMCETANILNTATSKSLVILDEIGRGTSTYDGISIAWAVAEYLLQDFFRPKTLFATHYFELTELPEQNHGASNWHIAVLETEGEVRFLRKIIPGSADKSYGIHVAKISGMPIEVVERSKQILAHLEIAHGQKKGLNPPKKKGKEKKFSSSQEVQLTLF